MEPLGPYGFAYGHPVDSGEDNLQKNYINPRLFNNFKWVGKSLRLRVEDTSAYADPPVYRQFIKSELAVKEFG